MSAERGMTEWTADGVDYIINDPNNAEEFDSTKNYAVRDHVYYKGILYVVVDPHSLFAMFLADSFTPVSGWYLLQKSL